MFVFSIKLTVYISRKYLWYTHYDSYYLLDDIWQHWAGPPCPGAWAVICQSVVPDRSSRGAVISRSWSWWCPRPRVCDLWTWCTAGEDASTYREARERCGSHMSEVCRDRAMRWHVWCTVSHRVSKHPWEIYPFKVRRAPDTITSHQPRPSPSAGYQGAQVGSKPCH